MKRYMQFYEEETVNGTTKHYTMDPDSDSVKGTDVKEFRNTGLLAFINTILHAFGWCIAVDIENNFLYPAKCKFRGFPQSSNDRMYRRMAEYMKNHADDVLEDTTPLEEIKSQTNKKN